jgi:hypothetical protein
MNPGQLRKQPAAGTKETADGRSIPALVPWKPPSATLGDLAKRQPLKNP